MFAARPARGPCPRVAALKQKWADFDGYVMPNRYAFAFSLCFCETGEGGIRTLGSLLGYGALAKRCFQPLSHLTKRSEPDRHCRREYREELRIANR